MINSYWIVVRKQQVVRLRSSGTRIYEALLDDIMGNRVPLDDLCGEVLVPMSPEIAKGKSHWVMYRDIEEVIRVAPIYDSIVDIVLDNSDIFKEPIELSTVYEILGL